MSLVNGADRGLCWYIEDGLGLFAIGPAGHSVSLSPSERRNTDGTCMRATADVFRRSPAEAVERHLPAWAGKVTPRVPPRFCASRLYPGGMNLFATRELPGHPWTVTTALRRWLIALPDGDTRARARSEATLYASLGSVRPFLDQWAGWHSHPREATESDIHDVLGPPRGYQRDDAIHAPRSLFGFAKKRGLVLTNPTVGVKARQTDPEMVPMTEPEIRAIEQLASKPAQRVTVALAAEHAARTGVIRTLTLDELDMPNRRITLEGHNQRLGELTHRASTARLDYHRATWPPTPHRHLLVNAKTVLGTGPVSGPFVRSRLGRNGFSIDRIRADRILHEALTTAPDPLHLTLVFNIEHSTALRYATVTEHLPSDEPEATGATETSRNH